MTESHSNFNSLGMHWLLVLAVLAGPLAAAASAQQWWQRGQDAWCYKDDWKGQFLTGGRSYTAATTVTVPDGAKIKAAFCYVWSGQGYNVKVNGEQIGRDIDAGTVEDYDLTNLLKPGDNRIEVSAGGEMNCEGGVVLEDGREILFAADQSWLPDARVAPTRRGGPRGYAGDAHMARILCITAEQKAKCAVNHVNSVRRRIETSDQYVFWKHRDPREVLDPASSTGPRQTWQKVTELLAAAQGPADEAARLIFGGKLAEAMEAIKPATAATDQAAQLLTDQIARLQADEAARAKAVNAATLKALEGQYTVNGSKYNRLGWVTSCEPLDNDPAYWEFDIYPAEARSLALAGLWEFRIDADTTWRNLFAPTKWGWERQGVTGPSGQNKSYNGVAWYRKTLTIPAAWTGKDLLLRLGPRWDNRDAISLNDVAATAGAISGDYTIPASAVKPGQANLLSIQVTNRSNIGGIINPGLRLSVAEAAPTVRRHVCAAGIARQHLYPAEDGSIEQVIYSSALSPAVVVATSGKTIRLGGWAARGYTQPELTQIDGGWLLKPAGNAPNAPRPVVVVGAASAQVVDDGFGGKAVEVTGQKIALVRLDAGKDNAAEMINLAAVIPVGYVEQTRFDGQTCTVRIGYEHLELGLPQGGERVPAAPLPMLASYAIESNWPGIKVEGDVKDLGLKADSGYYPGSDCGTYRAASGNMIAYSFDRMEPAKHWKGYGTLNEEERLGERMYENMAKWGANSYRPQLNLRTLLDSSGGLSARATTMLGMCEKYDMLCMVNWFAQQYVPPDQRQVFTDRWVAFAKACKDLPEYRVAYDFINEPANFTWDDYNAFMKQLTAAVREVDTVHWISIEAGNGWAQPEDLDRTVPTGDAKTIYQYHFYGPHTGDIYRPSLWYPRYEVEEERFRSYEGWEERMLSPIRFMVRNKEQVLHGEFGISFLGPDQSPRKWLEDVLSIHEKYRMHWNWWNYDGSNVQRTGLIAGERLNPLVETLTEYAKMGPPQ